MVDQAPRSKPEYCPNTGVYIWQKVLLMLDLNCLRSHELCLHTLVKWLYKLTIETPNVYVTKHRKFTLQHFCLPCRFIYQLKNHRAILIEPVVLTKSILEAFIKYSTSALLLRIIVDEHEPKKRFTQNLRIRRDISIEFKIFIPRIPWKLKNITLLNLKHALNPKNKIWFQKLFA